MSEPATGVHVLRGQLVTEHEHLADGVVAVTDGRISFAGPADRWPLADLPERSDVVLLPGLVDVHCHGGGGFGFPDDDAQGARAARAFHLGHGTTTMLASLVSAPGEVLAERVDLLAGLVRDGELAGIHLEGPFLATGRCGAQDPRHLVPGDPALLRKLLDAGGGTVRSMTLAPETAHFAELADLLADAGAVTSLGHGAATHAETTAAIRRAPGRVSATHLFNGMAPLHQRHPGMVGACLAAASRGEIVLELIGDGVHLAPETVAMVFDLVDPGGIALVTDSMAAAGMADGDYTLGPADVRVTGGVARLRTDSGEGALAGGTTSLLDVVRRTVRGGVDLHRAVTAASSTPARLLGLTDVGALRAGLRADVVVTGPDLRVRRVMRAGRWV